MRAASIALVAALGTSLLAAIACGGDDEGSLRARGGAGAEDGAPGNGSGGPGGGIDNPGAAQPLPEGTSVGKPGLRRLTNREYENSIRDAFDLGADWKGPQLTADRSSELGFDNDATLLEIDETRSAELASASESAADAILAANKLATLAGCQTASRACVETLTGGIAARLFRRPLADTEKQRYVGLFDTVAAQATPKDGVKWALAALLASPNFVYRQELGKAVDATRVALTGEEVATELAYTFGGTLPTEELLAKGRRGELFTAEARIAEARTLLATTRGREVLVDFTRQWLRYADVKDIAKDATLVPGFAAAREDMVNETRRFLDFVFYEKKGGIKELFTSADTFLTPALATHYGITAAASGPSQRPAEQAIGILAQGSLLSRYGLAQSSSPSQRGAFVRRKLLCQKLPPPPPNVGEPPIPQPGLTTRELYEKVHASQPSCGGCHQILDPVGFGLENFDVAGRYRTQEKGKPVDSSGMISNFGSGGNPKFANHKELASLLAASPDVADCIGGLMATYAFGAEEAKAYTTPESRAAIRAGSVGLLEYYAGLATAPEMVVRSTK